MDPNVPLKIPVEINVEDIKNHNKYHSLTQTGATITGLVPRNSAAAQSALVCFYLRLSGAGCLGLTSLSNQSLQVQSLLVSLQS